MSPPFLSSIDQLYREAGGHGVQYTPPPLEVLPSITAAVNTALANMDDDAKAALIGLGTDKGVNGAFLLKTDSGWNVALWIGKDWREPGVEWGAGVIKQWK